MNVVATGFEVVIAHLQSPRSWLWMVQQVSLEKQPGQLALLLVLLTPPVMQIVHCWLH